MKKPIRIQKRKLLKLAKMLLEDAKNQEGIRFDLGVVGKPSLGKDFNGPADVKLDCGTTACAMGLAAISGAFKKDGLSFSISDMCSMINTKFKGRVVDYDIAAKKLFGLSQEQANYLFSPWTYPYNARSGASAERRVVRRINSVVGGKKIRIRHY